MNLMKWIRCWFMFCGIVNRIFQTALLSNCQIKAKDSSYFTIKCFDNSVHHFKVLQKNNPEATRKVRFLSALLCSPDRSVYVRLCECVCYCSEVAGGHRGTFSLQHSLLLTRPRQWGRGRQCCVCTRAFWLASGEKWYLHLDLLMKSYLDNHICW